MANVVGDPGRWLTVTGTSSVPPVTSSSTEAVYFEVPAASEPKAIFAAARSSSVIVTVVVARGCADQPRGRCQRNGEGLVVLHQVIIGHGDR